MDSTAEPMEQADAVPSGAPEQVTNAPESPIEPQVGEPMDDDDAVLARLLNELNAVEEEPAPVSTEAVPEPVVDSPSFDREEATKVLKRDGVPDEIISAAPDALLADWVSKASKRQKDVDSYGSRMKQLESELAQTKTTAPPQEPATPATPAQPADPFASMAATYGEELVAPVRAAFHAQQQQMQERMLLAEARASDAALRVQFGSKAPSWDAVLAKMSELGNSKPGGYATVDELTRSAYQALVGSTKPAVNVKASQPTAPRASSPPVKPPPIDEDDLALERIMSGESPRRSR